MSLEPIFALATAGGIYGYLQLTQRIRSLEETLKTLTAAQANVQQTAPLATEAVPTAVQPVRPAVAPHAPTPPALEPWQTNPARYVGPEPSLPLVPSPKAAPRPAPVPVGPPSQLAQATETFMGLVKKNPFASLGVLLMLIGVGFLFAWLAVNNILPPAARVGLLAMAGAGVFAFGLREEEKRFSLAMNLQGGALALQFLCALWAYKGYGLISPLTAFVWMGGLSTAAVGWATYKRRTLFAFMGIVGALLTPIFASSGHGEFSGLVMYCAYVSALALGAGAYLNVPSLASTTLAGVSALLGAALKITPGSAAMSAVGLFAMWSAYSAAALAWTRKTIDWMPRQQASLVAVLLGAPLIMAGFLYGRADISEKGCALWLGLTAIAYLFTMVSASDKGKASLFAIGAGLGLVALGVGLEGAGRALALSAAALGMIMVARAVTKPWARRGALVYWVYAVALGVAELKHGSFLSAMPLAISGGVALAAGFFSRSTRLGMFYTVVAPLILVIASLWDRSNLHFLVPEWFFAWAMFSYLIGKATRWLELRLSAVWLLPAGLGLFVADLPMPLTAGGLFHREAVLLAWAFGGATLVWSYHKDVLVKFSLSRDIRARATLLLPALASIELVHSMSDFDASTTAILGSLMLLWAGWHLGARVFKSVQGFDAEVIASGAIAATIVGLNVLTAVPGFGWTLLQGVSLAALAYGVVRYPSADARSEKVALACLAAAVGLGILLRVIGIANGVDAHVLQLAVTRVMQPWISLLWAAASISVVAFASNKKNRQMWMAGGAAVAVLIAKMLLVDLATFTLPAKVGVFMATGLAFVALGYFCPLPPENVEEEKAAENPPA